MTDKIEQHHRQQLSALMDGALAPDEARFLLRRLQHDDELGGCWERWQLAGDVLRGQATAVLPTGFAERVSRALAAGTAVDAPVVAASRPRWARWGGGAALAASVAVAVLLMARPEGPASEPALAVDASGTPAVTARPSPVPAPPPAIDNRAAAVAMTDAPRAPSRRMSVRNRQRATDVPSPAPPAGPVVVATPTEASTVATASRPDDPFATRPAPTSRPWPRAVLPQYSTGGALTAGTESTSTISFYPFDPRLPAQDDPTPDAAPPPQ